VEIVKADYLNDHQQVEDALVERVGEMLTGANVMNCRLCKYRERVIGYEGDVGAPQAGHHLHVPRHRHRRRPCASPPRRTRSSPPARPRSRA
jgi:hypothetical protein